MKLTTKSNTNSLQVDQINKGIDCAINSLLLNVLQLFSGGSGVNVVGPPTFSDPNLFRQIQRNAS